MRRFQRASQRPVKSSIYVTPATPAASKNAPSMALGSTARRSSVAAAHARNCTMSKRFFFSRSAKALPERTLFRAPDLYTRPQAAIQPSSRDTLCSSGSDVRQDASSFPRRRHAGFAVTLKCKACTFRRRSVTAPHAWPRARLTPDYIFAP